MAQQGTVHFYREAVEEGSGISLSRLFDNGIDLESEEMMSKWLPLAAYETLLREGRVQINLNNNSAQFDLIDEGTHQVTVDGQEMVLPVIHVKDNRRGSWIFYKNADNPLLIEYKTAYYHEFLKSITTQGNGDFRWIRQVPPIK